MKTFGLVGWSGSGKTTLMVKLVPEMTARGFRVSTMKHTHHNFEIDHPGKDSYEHRMAGATEVMITSGRRWALVHELRDEPEGTVEDMIAKMSPVDLLLIEGFKYHPHPKIEVYRPSVGKPMLAPEDESIVAVASDEAVNGLRVPLLDLDDLTAIADFIVAFLGLAEAERTGAAQG